MLEQSGDLDFLPIPNKRYFSIGEVSDLCKVKPHVLRYWEQEFPSLSPLKRRGNRRYYQRQDVFLVREIRSLLYQKGYTVLGAKQHLNSEGTQQDQVKSKQIIRQLRAELEDILSVLKS